MPARRALRLLRPLLTQPRRPCSSCTGRGTPPPCPPCKSAPPPPCRADHKPPLQGQRIVCCPPPQGKRPPCAKSDPECARTCEHQLPQQEPSKKTGPKKLCGAARDAVAQRFRGYEEYRRRQYELAVAERLANPQKRPVPPAYNMQPAMKHAIATDGRSYEVLSDAPAPRCSAASSHCSTPHPPPQPVTLAPPGDCHPKERPVLDPCGNTPRTILTIDRGDPDNQQTGSASPKSGHENPKNDNKASYKGITSRIMDSLRSGRGSSAEKQPDWCRKPPPPASPPPRCRPPTLTDRIRRKSPTSGKRHLHTSTVYMTTKEAPKSTGHEALLAASKKLAAVLSARDLLKEAGRGRVVCSPTCKPPLPPPPPLPPRVNGGAMEFNVPAGADTVCVRVSMGKASSTPIGPTSPAATPSRLSACPPPSCGVPRPPQNASSDSWLSIKKLQKKISSSCGRSEPAAPPATPPPPSTPPSPPAPQQTPAPSRPKPPAPCSPQGKVKMSDVLPHTIFVK